jgi:hypothetical protein
MPKQKEPKAKAPAKINPLTEYLIEESVREGAGPDPETQAQIDLLNAEDEPEAVQVEDQPAKKTAPRAQPPKTKSKPRAKKSKKKAVIPCKRVDGRNNNCKANRKGSGQ